MSVSSKKAVKLVRAYKLAKNRFVLQLDCPSDGHWEAIGTTSYLGPISNLRPFLDSSAQTTRGMLLDFFFNLKMASLDQFKNVAAKSAFQGGFVRASMIELNN